MAKRFGIDLQLNTSQAESASARTIAAIARVEKEAIKVAVAAERLAVREAAAREKASVQAQRAAERKAEGEVRAAERAARQRMTIEDRMLARENARSIAAERATQREADGKVRAKEREARQLRLIEDRLLKAEHDRQLAAARAKGKADEKTGGWTGMFTELSAGLNLAQQGLGLVTGILQGFEAVDKSVMRSAGFVTDYRESLLELAALKGKLGDTGEAMKEELAFRGKTLQTQEQARTFQESFLGVAQSSIDAKNIKGEVIRKGLMTQAEADKLAVMGGKFQTVEGGDAATHGGLLGIIPQMIGRRTTAEEVFTKEQQLYNIFQPGGVSFSALAKQFTELTPLIKGGIYKDTEAAALTSAFSTIAMGSGQAGTMVQQFTRGTVGGLGRMRGAKMMEGTDDTETEKQGEYLRGLGATNQMDPIQIGHLIGRDFQKESAAEQAKGRKFNPMDYLRHKGYGNQQDVDALMAFAGLEGYVATPEVEELKRSGKYKGAFTEAFMPLASDAARPTAKDALAPIETALAVDPVFQRRKTALAGFSSDVFAGVGAPEHYKELMGQAYSMAQMGLGKDPLSKFATFGMGDFKDLGALSGGGFGGMALQMTNKTLAEQLSEKGAGVGMQPFSYGAMSMTDQQRAGDVWQYEQEVVRRGGQPGLDMSKVEALMEKQLDESRALRRAYEQGAGARAALPSGAPPAAGAIR